MDVTDKEQRFSKCCEELRLLYTQELNLICNRCADFLDKHSFLQAQSVLSVIKKSYWETYHSLLIKYVLENQNGGKVLHYFLKSIGVETSWLESVLNQQYTIEEEHTILNQRYKSWNGKRIDLLICDDVNKWLIVVENKVLSSVHNSTESKSQLDIYHCYCQNSKRWDMYDKVYVLLDYKDCNSNYKEWVSANYINLFSSILANKPEDSVVEDYLRTLYSILSPIDKIVTLKEATSFNKEIIEKI